MKTPSTINIIAISYKVGYISKNNKHNYLKLFVDIETIKLKNPGFFSAI